MAKTLEVFLHDQPVGQLRQEDDGRLSFTYTTDWLARPNAEALSHHLPLKSDTYSHGPTKAFFGGILPEGEVRVRLARVLGVSERNDFSLLAEIGGDCAGAVSLKAVGETPPKAHVERILLKTLDFERILKQLPDKPLLVDEGVRLSLAGAQNKIALVKENGNFFLPEANEPTSHILKIAASNLDQILENELFCLRLAQSMDIPSAHATLERAGIIYFLCLDRYDREKDAQGKNYRLHQEDFCQAAGVDAENKYQTEGGPSLVQCIGLIRSASTYKAVDIERFLKLTIFNFLIGNADAHAKNFSFLRNQGHVTLAPAYDLICTAVYPNLHQKMAMKIGSKYEPLQVYERHWKELAQEIEIKPAYLVQLLRNMATLMDQAALAEEKKLELEIGSREIYERIRDVIHQRVNHVLRMPV